MKKRIYENIKGEKIDLSQLSFQELQELNLQEEIFFAQEIKKLKPFSKQRNDYLKLAYEKIFQISDWKKEKSNAIEKKKGNGVEKGTIKLLKKLIEVKLKEKSEVLFYEAGVGKGYTLENIRRENIQIKGCDVFLSEDAKKLDKENENITLIENNIFDALDEIEDEDIDVFYADNVLEHIVPDEYEATCEKIFRKLKKTGIAILIIPNSYTGPHDITRYAFPLGTKAKGFHFMEQSYSENMKIFKKYNMRTKYLGWINRKGDILIFRNRFRIDELKIKMEKILGRMVGKGLSCRLFKKVGYNIYLLTK